MLNLIPCSVWRTLLSLQINFRDNGSGGSCRSSSAPSLESYRRVGSSYPPSLLTSTETPTTARDVQVSLMMSRLLPSACSN